MLTGNMIGFNPCSLGCCSESMDILDIYKKLMICFNPCSLGCCSESMQVWASKFA